MASPAPRRFALLFVLAFLGAWAAWSAPLVYVDPYGAFRRLGLPHLDWPIRPWTRVGAAERLLDPACDIAVLGTSKVVFAFGVSPPRTGDEVVCNGAFGGATMREVEAAVDLLVRRGSASRAVLFLDLAMFHDGRTYLEDFKVSQMGPGRTPLAYYAWVGTSWEAFVQLAQGFGWHGGPIPRERRGFQHFAGAHAITRTFLRKPEYYRGLRHLDEQMASLGRAVDTLQRSRIEPIVVIAPSHALDMENLRTAGLWDLHGRWKLDVAALMEGQDPRLRGWDFHRYHRPATTPLPFYRHQPAHPWWIDPIHPTELMGRSILHKIHDDLEGRAGDWEEEFGAPLTVASVRADRAKAEAQRHAWLRAYPEQAEAYRETVNRLIEEAPELPQAWTATAAWFGDPTPPLFPEFRVDDVTP